MGAPFAALYYSALANILPQLDGSILATQFSHFAFGKSSRRYFSKNHSRLQFSRRQFFRYSALTRVETLVDNSIKIYRPPSLAPTRSDLLNCFSKSLRTFIAGR